MELLQISAFGSAPSSPQAQQDLLLWHDKQGVWFRHTLEYWKARNRDGFANTKSWRCPNQQKKGGERMSAPKLKLLIKFSGSGGGVDMIDSGQQQMLAHMAAYRWGQLPDWRHKLAEQTPESRSRKARSGNAGGSQSGGGALERQASGQGRGKRWAEAGVRQRGRIRRRGLARGGGEGSRLRTGIPGRGCARAVLGPWRVESRRAPAEGGGAVARESGTPSGSGRDADCCGSSGKAAGYVTRGSLPHQRSLGP